MPLITPTPGGGGATSVETDDQSAANFMSAIQSIVGLVQSRDQQIKNVNDALAIDLSGAIAGESATPANPDATAAYTAWAIATQRHQNELNALRLSLSDGSALAATLQRSREFFNSYNGLVGSNYNLQHALSQANDKITSLQTQLANAQAAGAGGGNIQQVPPPQTSQPTSSAMIIGIVIALAAAGAGTWWIMDHNKKTRGG